MYDIMSYDSYLLLKEYISSKYTVKPLKPIFVLLCLEGFAVEWIELKCLAFPSEVEIKGGLLMERNFTLCLYELKFRLRKY